MTTLTEDEEPVFYLEQVGAFIPPADASVRELGEPLGLTPSQINLYQRFLGLDRVVLAGDTDLAEMLTAAGEEALRGVDRDSVRYLIHTHTMQHVAPPDQLTLEGVRVKLGLNNASVFGMSHLNCVVGMYALEVARYLLVNARPEQKVLIVSGEKVLSPRLRAIPETTIMGEASAACLVGRDPRGHRVEGRALTVLGRFYQGLGASAELLSEYKHIYSAELGKVIRAAIQDAGREPGDIDVVLPHNVNRLSWKHISRDLGIDKDRIFLDNVPRLGHCFGSDPFINLAQARAAGQVKPGDLVVMATAGLGATFAAAVVRIGQGTDRPHAEQTPQTELRPQTEPRPHAEQSPQTEPRLPEMVNTAS